MTPATQEHQLVEADESSLASLWHQLPEELHDKIIAHIQAPELFAIRAACKHWESLISCPRFLRFCSEIPRPPHWILVPKWPTYMGFFAFLPGSSKWIDLPFGLPLTLHVESALHKNQTSLLLRTPIYSFPHRLHIYNPLRKSPSQIIKCPDAIRGTAVLIQSTDRKQGSFKIFAISGSRAEVPNKDSGEECFMDLQATCYDSTTGFWGNQGRLMNRDAMLIGSNVQKRSPVLVDLEEGFLMLLLGESNNSQELFAYQTQKQKWTQIQLPDGGLSMNNWIIQCNAVFLLQLNSFNRRIHLWRLDEIEEWAEKKQIKWVSEVADFEIDARFLDENKSAFVEDCIGVGNRIVLCKMPNFLSYDPRAKIWEWFPAVEEKTDCVSRAFAYCPQFGVVVSSSSCCSSEFNQLITLRC